MGKDWDHDKGGRIEWIKWMKEVMEEAKRTLKPGGHALIWALPRTSHWTATALEDAGFEIRDVITHVFGSGFPKSHNIQKKIEGDIKWKIELVNANNVEQILFPSIEAKEMDGQDFVQENVLVKIKEGEQLEYVKIVDWNTICQEHTLEKVMGFSVVMNVKQLGNNNLQVQLIPIGKVEDLKEQMVMLVSTLQMDIDLNTTSLWKNILEGNLEDLKKSITLTKLKTIIGLKTYNLLQNQNTLKSIVGQGTGLKPASEHWILCRKPLSEKTIADNVLKWGTGGLNIDKSRIEHNEDLSVERDGHKLDTNEQGWGFKAVSRSNEGRFPSNFCHDGSDEVMEEFDKTNIKKQTIYTKKTLCGKTLENQKEDGMSYGEIQEVENYIKNAKQFISGNLTMEFVQKDTMFIILTLIKQMMTLQTYNYLQKKNTTTYIVDYEKTIKLLMELNIENVKNVENIKHLIISILEKVEPIRDFVKSVQQQNLNCGEKETENTITNTTENIEQSSARFFYCSKPSGKEKNEGLDDLPLAEIKGRDEGQDERNSPYKVRPSIGATYAGQQTTSKIGGSPDKPTKQTKNNHPTIKSVKLMTYLINMITPPNGIVLDPFMGSGSTGVAAVKSKYNFIGIEKEPDYMEIAKARIKYNNK